MILDHTNDTGLTLVCDCDKCKRAKVPSAFLIDDDDIADIVLAIEKAGWSIPSLDVAIKMRDYITFTQELCRLRTQSASPSAYGNTRGIKPGYVTLGFKCYAPGHAPSETDDADESICETAPSTREELLLDKWRKAALEAHKQLTAALLMTRVGELSFAPNVSKETADKVRGMWADAIATTTSLIFEDAKAREILDLTHAVFLSNVAFDKINE